jgi:hypothetical protein
LELLALFVLNLLADAPLLSLIAKNASVKRHVRMDDREATPPRRGLVSVVRTLAHVSLAIGGGSLFRALLSRRAWGVERRGTTGYAGWDGVRRRRIMARMAS